MPVHRRQNIDINSKSRNPFVGIRPLHTTERHLFFGRDKHVKPIVDKLINNNFVVISGASGVGKSSLVNCGIIPEMLTEGDWVEIHSELDGNPLVNLQNDLLKVVPAGRSVLKDEGNISNSQLLQKLEVNINSSDTNYLLIIDQFEQLVIGRERYPDDSREKTIANYIALLVDLIHHPKLPFYILLTVRSDFFDEFSGFSEFTDLMKSSDYLLPQMSDNDLKEAISKPLAYMAVEWDPELPEKIINDLSGKPDKLPLMQHVLMRCYNIKSEAIPSEKFISLEAYEDIGTVNYALEKHIEEVYEELDDRDKKLCERIFKSITYKTPDNRYTSLPVKIKELSQIAQVDDYHIVKLVNRFNRRDRNFLTPPQDTLLSGDTYINLSHEVLIRNWERLKKWVEEEAESIQLYKRLAEAAYMFQLGKTELWKPPELYKAVEWREKNRPNVTWARRHNPAFERSMVFLNLSENEDHQIQERQKRKQKLRKRWTTILSSLAGIVVVLALAIIFLSKDNANPSSTGNQAQTNQEAGIRIDRSDNTSNTEISGRQERIRQDMEEANIPGDTRIMENTASNEESDQEEENITSDRERDIETRRLQEEARRRNEREETATQIAANTENNRTRNTPTEVVVDQSADTETSESEENINTSSDSELSRERMSELSRSLASISIETSEDQDLKALLAYQSYLFDQEVNNNNFNSLIYESLYRAMASQLGNSFNALKGPSKAVRSVAFLPNSSFFLTAGSNGSVLKWNSAGEDKDPSTVLSGRGILEKIGITRDGRWLIMAENRNGILVENLSIPGSAPEKIIGEDENIRSIALATDNNTFFTAGTENFIERFDITSRSSEIVIETDSRINSIALSPNNQTLVAGTRSGEIIRFDVDGNFVRNVIFNDPGNAVHSIRFSPDGRYLACGTVGGKILLFSTGNYEVVRELTGHTARVTEIDFSPDGRFLASSAYDGKVILWNIQGSAVPVIFDDNGGFVFTVKFSKTGDHFVSGSAQENRLVVRPVSSSDLADRICFLVSRNMSEEEWQNYIGNDIPYRATCPNK